MILCPGDINTKARIFYDVLQDQLQDSISASDKDFEVSFFKVIDLGTKLAYKFEPEINPDSTAEDLQDKYEKIDDLKETLAEDFLDQIFDTNSKLSRKEYIKLLVEKQQWIFSPKEIRATVEKAMA